MSAFADLQQSIRLGSGGALTGRLLEARSAEDARAAALGEPREPSQRSKKVYGATPTVLEVVAEAQVMGAGSHELRGHELQNGRPHGGAAGGPERCSAHRRCSARIDRRRWSR